MNLERIKANLPTVVSIAAGVLGLGFWFKGELEPIKLDQAFLKRDVAEIRATLREMPSAWTAREMKQWASALQATNPAMRVPEVYDH